MQGATPKQNKEGVTAMTLNDIKPGELAVVKTLSCTGDTRRRLLDMGLVENTLIECVGTSPCGDPCAYLVRGAVIAIRSQQCDCIQVERWK